MVIMFTVQWKTVLLDRPRNLRLLTVYHERIQPNFQDCIMKIKSFLQY